ncbi:DUF4430 domain-containing protein [Sporosarcina sp. P29]|uniref:DUF4430 domain-containing protein n=1 Tax=Sporosarcina sp. P29 TaxID=2048252 RepID=UPI000C170AD5|nr:DUF4430 domain-containing protein [Sporosarcina sp. P29]PIC99955.1 hypothetical protein CSV68_05735 [Sporosarcina sp. P29]
MGNSKQVNILLSMLLSVLWVLMSFNPIVHANEQFKSEEEKVEVADSVKEFDKERTAGIYVNNYEYGENVFESAITLDIEAIDDKGQNLVPRVEMNNVFIKPNNEQLYEIKLSEGLNTIFLSAIDSKGQNIKRVFYLSYSKVKAIEFVPAPGQYTNGSYTTDAVKKIRSKNGGLLSLGGFGGYLVVEFEEPIKNDPLNPYGIDFTVFGNPFEVNGKPGIYNQEPGAVEVAVHKDGPWYHLAGSEYKNDDTYTDYEVTYWNPAGQSENAGKWFDNKGREGLLGGRRYPSPDQFPTVNQEKYTLSGVSILNNFSASEIGTEKKQISYGYVDSIPVLNTNYEQPNNPYTTPIQGSGGDAMDISWAVDEHGKPIHLEEIKYVKVYSAINKFSGNLGEVSTEISGMGASHPVKQLPSSIEIKSEQNYENLPLGNSVKLYADAYDAENKEVIIPEVAWTSSNEDLARVNPITGVVTAIGEGEVVITASLKADSTISSNIQLTIGQKQIPTTITVNSGSPHVSNVGGGIIYTANVLDQHGNEIAGIENGFTWSAPEGSQVEVNSFGKTEHKKMVKGLKPGTVQIKVEYEGITGGVIHKVLDPDISLDVSGTAFVNSKNLISKMEKAQLKESLLNIRAMNENYVKFYVSDIKRLEEKSITTTIEAKKYAITLPDLSDIINLETHEGFLITHERINALTAPPTLRLIGNSLEFQMMLTKGKDTIEKIKEFPNQQSAMFISKFEDHELQGIDTAKLAAYEFIDETSQWVKLGGTYNIEGKSFEFSATHPGKFAVFEDTSIQVEEIPVKVRVEGFNKTIVPLTEISIKPYDITHVVGNNKVGNWYVTEKNPLAIHAIVKALESNGFNVSDKKKLDISQGNYITSIDGLKTFDINPGFDGWMYAVNNQYIDRGIADYALAANDEVTLYFTTDFTSQIYSWFDQEELTTTSEQRVNIRLKQEGGVVGDATILLNDEPFIINGQEVKTNAEGVASIVFAEPGEYLLSAEKKNGKFSSITRPYSKIIVGEKAVADKHKAKVKIDGLNGSILSDTEVTFETGSTIVQVVEQLLKEQNIPYELDQAKKNFVSINNVQNGSLHGSDQWVVDVNAGSSTSLIDNTVNENDNLHIFYKRNAVLESMTKLKVGDKDPTIELTLSGDTFTEAASDVSNWTTESGALTIGSVTVESNQKVLLHVQGEVPNEALSITGLAEVVQSNVKTTANITPSIPEVIRTVDDMLADTLRFYEVERYNKANFRWSMPGISWTELVALGASSSQLSDGTAQLPDWLTKDPGLRQDESDTDHIRYIFGLLAAGKDPSTAWETKRNLYAELAAQQKADGSIGSINKHAWAMLALDTGEKRGQDVGTWDNTTKEKALQHVLKQEKEKGGFSLSLKAKDAADPDMTGMVLLALANYQDDSAVNAAIERAKHVLREQQLDTAGWGAWGENSNSIATVISGLVALGEDVTSADWQKGGKSPVDALSKFQTKNGAFAFTLPADQWVNAKALEQSFIALQEIKTGKSVWQQFSDVENVEPPVETVDKAQLTAAIQTAEEKLASTQEGTTAGTFTKASRDQLQSTIVDAKAIEVNEEVDQQQVIVAISDLKQAITQYENSIIKPVVTPPADPTYITFSVETRTMGTGDIISPKQFKIESGDTAFTILKREVDNRSIPIKFSGIGPTIYVKSINNLGEFDGGPLSGWMYSVNGEFPQYSAGIYELEKDDILRWQYTKNLGEDIGDNWTPTPKPDPKPDPTPEHSVDTPENVKATITDGKLQIQVKDEKTGEFQPAKVEKTEVLDGIMIVQIGETGEVLDALTGLELPAGIVQAVVLDNDQPYNYFDSESEIKTTKEWNIKFSGTLQNDPANLDNVVVRNAKGEIIKVSTTLGEDGKSLKIKPTTKYTQGELYYLTITEVKSANGKVIKEPIRKVFVIE